MPFLLKLAVLIVLVLNQAILACEVKRLYTAKGYDEPSLVITIICYILVSFIVISVAWIG